MKSNQTTLIALYLVRGIFFLLLLMYIGLIVGVIHWHADKSAYDGVYLNTDFRAGLSTVNFTFSKESSESLSVAQLPARTIYWILIRSTIIAFFVVLILREIIQVLTSIANLQTFYEHNIRSFRKMANFGLVLTILGAINMDTINSIVHFTIPFGPIFFMVACFVLSEIFREGKRLMDDTNSIV